MTHIPSMLFGKFVKWSNCAWRRNFYVSQTRVSSYSFIGWQQQQKKKNEGCIFSHFCFRSALSLSFFSDSHLTKVSLFCDVIVICLYIYTILFSRLFLLFIYSFFFSIRVSAMIDAKYWSCRHLVCEV